MQTTAYPLQTNFFPEHDTLLPRRSSPSGRSKMNAPTLLTAVEEKLLLALYRFHYLSIDQVVSYLGMSINSTNWIRKKLRSLKDQGFIDTQYLPRDTPHGSLPIIYMLGTEAIHHFKEIGFPVSYHSPKERIRSFLFLHHTLELNALLIAASRLSQSVPQITLTGLKHERVLKHMPCKIECGNGKTASLVPDGWLDWQLETPFGTPGADRLSVFVELDRDTEDSTQFKPKVRNYLAFANGGYTTFGSESFNVVFLVALGADRRVQQLRKWTLEELTVHDALPYALFFKFATLPPSPIDPVSLFLAPHWYSLENDTKVSLIEKIL